MATGTYSAWPADLDPDHVPPTPHQLCPGGCGECHNCRPWLGCDECVAGRKGELAAELEAWVVEVRLDPVVVLQLMGADGLRRSSPLCRYGDPDGGAKITISGAQVVLRDGRDNALAAVAAGRPTMPVEFVVEASAESFDDMGDFEIMRGLAAGEDVIVTSLAHDESECAEHGLSPADSVLFAPVGELPED